MPVFVILILTSLAAMITHIWVMVGALFDKGETLMELIVLALGVGVPFVGVIHGIVIWFGGGII